MISKIKIKYKNIFKKLVRYGVGGLMGAGINIFTLWFFTDILGIYYIFSAILAFLLSLIIGFFFQKYITFNNYSRTHIKQMILFCLFQGIGLGMELISLWLFVDNLGLYYLYVSIFNKGIIFIWNFIMNYFFTFYKDK